MWKGVFGRRNTQRMSGGSGSNRLRWWVCFSGVLHLVLLAMLLLVPPSTARRDAPHRVYAVDLVGSGPAPVAKASPVLAPAVPEPPKPAEAPVEVEAPSKERVKEAPKPKEEAPPALTEPAPPERPKKKVVEPAKPARPKKVAKPEKKPKPKPKVVKREKPAPKKTAAKKVSRKSPAKKPSKVAKKKPKGKRKSDAGADSRLVERVRKRRIDDAVAVARERARLRRAARREGGGAVGAGTGTSSNGGVVRGMEFLAYRQQMHDQIKERWTWIGKRSGLEVTVGFGIRADGQVFGLKLLKSSGDTSFDESAVRAVRRASLPPPPASHARDFAEVELTFRPTDLDG